MKTGFVKIDREEIEKIIKLLNFVLSLDDLEIMKPTIESVIELLEEVQE